MLWIYIYESVFVKILIEDVNGVERKSVRSKNNLSSFCGLLFSYFIIEISEYVWNISKCPQIFKNVFVSLRYVTFSLSFHDKAGKWDSSLQFLVSQFQKLGIYLRIVRITYRRFKKFRVCLSKPSCKSLPYHGAQSRKIISHKTPNSWYEPHS